MDGCPVMDHTWYFHTFIHQKPSRIWTYIFQGASFTTNGHIDIKGDGDAVFTYAGPLKSREESVYAVALSYYNLRKDGARHPWTLKMLVR